MHCWTASPNRQEVPKLRDCTKKFEEPDTWAPWRWGGDWASASGRVGSTILRAVRLPQRKRLLRSDGTYGIGWDPLSRRFHFSPYSCHLILAVDAAIRRVRLRGTVRKEGLRLACSRFPHALTKGILNGLGGA
jgi:hypothetical protein